MKKSSYQKLKEKNAQLKKDIDILVNDSKSFRAIELNIIYMRPKIFPLNGFSEKLKSSISNVIQRQFVSPDEKELSGKLDLDTIRKVLSEIMENKPP